MSRSTLRRSVRVLLAGLLLGGGAAVAAPAHGPDGGTAGGAAPAPDPDAGAAGRGAPAAAQDDSPSQAPSPAPPPGTLPGALLAERLERVDALLRRLSEARAFSGEVLIALGDEVLLDEQYGFDRWDERRPFARPAIFKIGSITKQFTAAAILRLAEQGRLALDDPLGRHVPELDRGVLELQGRPLTLHHLLTQTSGLPSVDYGNPLGAEVPFANVVRALRGQRLRHPPGEQFHYESLNFVLAGEVVRRVTGSSYEAYLREAFFDPLGMPDTGIRRTSEQRERFADGHLSTGLGLQPSRDLLGNLLKGEYDWDLGAGGSLFSSAADLHVWLNALRQGRVLRPDSLATLLTPAHERYACGWVVKTDPGRPARRLAWHNGAISPFGYKADVSFSPDDELLLVVLGNLDHGAIEPDVHDDILRVLWGGQPAAQRASFGTWHGIALALWLRLHLLAALLHAAYALRWRRPRSRLDLYGQGASALAVSAVAAALTPGWPALLLLVATLGLLGWAWRSFHGQLPLLHRKRWLHLAEGAATLGACGVLGWLVVVLLS